MHLLKLLDQYLTPQEAAPYMEMARQVLQGHKEVMGGRFKSAIQTGRWIDALNLGEQIMRQFPNSKFAEEVEGMMSMLQQKASEESNVGFAPQVG